MGMMLNASHRFINRGFNANQDTAALIFSPGASPRMYRSFAVNGDRKKFTVHLEVKLTDLTGGAQILWQGYLNSSNRIQIGLDSSRRIQVYGLTGGAVICNIVTSRKITDTTGHLFLTIGVDSSQATDTDRVTIEVNKEVVSDFDTATYPTLNREFWVNNTSYISNLGNDASQGTSYFGGVISRFVYAADQKILSDSFCKLDRRGKVPVAIEPTYTANDNNSLLDFSDKSTAAALGMDSANNNDFTVVNIAVDDSVEDTWSNNFSTSNVHDSDRANITTSYGNLKVVKATASSSPSVLASIGVTTGKYYAEITWVSITDSAPNANYIVTGVTTRDGLNAVNYFAGNSSAASENGDKQIITASSSSGFLPYGDGYWVAGSKIGIALDLDAGEVTFYKNGVSQGSITLPATSDHWYFYNTSDGTNNGYTAMWNFGQKPFAYALPEGFKSLCTANLPKPEKASDVTPLTGSFTGTASSNPNFVFLGYTPDQDGACTINGNAITWGTHAIATAGGFYTITSSASYNASGSNTYSIAVKYPGGGKGIAPAPAQIN